MNYRAGGIAAGVGLVVMTIATGALAADPEVEKKGDNEGCRRAVEITVQAVKAIDAVEEERLYSEAITACATLAEARYNRALLYRRQEKRELALRDLTKALEVRDDDRFRIARGRVHGELQQFEEARADFNAVLNRSPTDGGALIGLATVVEAQGDRAQAIHLLERGREADPTSALIRFNLGVLYELSGRMNEADGEYTPLKEEFLVFSATLLMKAT